MSGNTQPTLRRSVLPYLLCLAMAAGFISCDRTRMDKGREYFPDMAHSLAYVTYSDNPAMEDGKTMRSPVAGTVPRHMIPYPYSADFEGRELAGQYLENPLMIDSLTLEQGQALYTTFCSNCHGIEGDGLGNLFTTGRYIIPPTNLTSDVVREHPAGELYHVITAGWGVMGAHGSLIQPEDRWKIISFIEVVFHEK